ncbi:MAG TPA: DinB family protein [Panacibacter sp.]|nr:DinB family protein [Panacibacter sp.]HNP45202.1 DinB family protein [Panacibacter sp.]
MNKQEIIEKLNENYNEFTGFIAAMEEPDFLFSKDDKWSPGQQAEHILKSIKPVRFAFSLPKPVLRMLFGKSNRPSKTIEGLSIKYKHKLAEGGKASAPYIPAIVQYKKKQALTSAINNVNAAIVSKVERCNEESLDIYILPHPLLGKVTLREMLYFNIIHVKHHYYSILQLLDSQ